MIDLLDNCQFGNYKFLFISWTFAVRLDGENKKSAHKFNYHWRGPLCFAMGTRFSSSYLKISNLKTHFPKVPFLALTATAKSKEDIIKELGLKEPQLLRNRLQGKILLTWFLKKINSFESNKFLEKHPILHNLCPKQKVLYRNFIPLHL
jgi:ATP-dependent DNA helicase RecQ